MDRRYEDKGVRQGATKKKWHGFLGEVDAGNVSLAEFKAVCKAQEALLAGVSDGDRRNPRSSS